MSDIEMCYHHAGIRFLYTPLLFKYRFYIAFKLRTGQYGSIISRYDKHFAVYFANGRARLHGRHELQKWRENATAAIYRYLLFFIY